MSDEQPTDAVAHSQTGIVREIPGPNGGVLRTGGRQKPSQPTLADCNALARKRVYQLIPAMNRIAQNKPKRGAKKGPYSVAAQIAAFAELRRLANDRTLSESTVSAKLAATVAEIVDHVGRDAAQPLLQKLAPIWWDT